MEGLLKKINSLFENAKLNNQKNTMKTIPDIIFKKINLDDDKLAVERIVTVWESLNKNKIFKPNNWIKFKWFLKAMKFRDFIRKELKRISQKRFGQKKKNQKFPALDINDISERVNKLQKILGIDKKLECKLLSDQTILIK